MTRNTLQQHHLSISITVPCLNESKNIGATLETLEIALEHIEDYEIIVINDGSTDDTATIVQKYQAKNPRISLINHSSNMGRGYSIREGYLKSTKDYVVCFNGKHDIESTQICTILDQLGNSDLIISYQANTNERPLIRKTLSKLFTFILNRSFNLNLKYYNGSSLIKRDLIKNLEIHTSSYAIDAEILIKLIKSGINYQEVPVFDIIEDERRTRSNSLANILGVIKFFVLTFFEINIFRKRY